MDDNQKREWDILARRFSRLRFPTVRLDSRNAFNPTTRGNVRLETFVASKDKSRLTLLRQEYEYHCKEDVFKVLETTKERFLSTGKLLEDNFIFSEEHSIKEPYKINEL